jgi:alginate O-acetyltransferase complex protein AlgI
MTFNSLEYGLFLPVVVVVYWQLSRRPQNALVLVASYVFYAVFDWRFLGLLVLSTVLDFSFGRSLRGAPPHRRRRWLVASLVVNLGILGLFKYLDFFVDSAADLLGTVGVEANPSLLRVVLPIGISFYTFHGISYVFDIYRGDVEPADDLLDYACFVAFFPQLVAGPIGRAHVQLPQFERPRQRPDAAGVRSALLLILLGLVKKVAIADAVAPVANAAFADPGRAGTVSLALGALAFAIQIYGDFSGYSDIARGSARLLGIELPRNFAQPYLSRSITEFWRRWHISLSTWLRDYLYIPLGGNRSSSFVTYRNLLVTMALGGLWHGASWTFVLWGVGHGAALAVHRGWREHRGVGADDEARGSAVVRRVTTFGLVTALWILFRSPSIAIARGYARGLVSWRGGVVNLDDVFVVVAAAAAVIVIDLLERRPEPAAAARPLAVALGVLAVLVWSGGSPVPFLYFRF